MFEKYAILQEIMLQNYEKLSTFSGSENSFMLLK